MIFKAIILGIVQGVTEFLPISSSGHLVLAGELLKFESEGIIFEVMVHFATLIAIVIVFARRIGKIIKSIFTSRIQIKGGGWVVKNDDLAMFFYLIWASIPAALVGFFLRTQIGNLFANPLLVSIMLVVTGIILFSTRFITKGETHKHNGISATMIGIAQAFAIIPGISRSGTTISAGLWSGISREASAEFSFILVIPAILGAMVLEIKDMTVSVQQGTMAYYIVGSIAAFVTGLLALIFLLKVVKRGKLHFFAYYCWLVAIVTLIVRSLKIS
jgi:undecaprenyl-diphosphatase